MTSIYRGQGLRAKFKGYELPSNTKDRPAMVVPVALSELAAAASDGVAVRTIYYFSYFPIAASLEKRANAELKRDIVSAAVDKICDDDRRHRRFKSERSLKIRAGKLVRGTKGGEHHLATICGYADAALVYIDQALGGDVDLGCLRVNIEHLLEGDNKAIFNFYKREKESRMRAVAERIEELGYGAKRVKGIFLRAYEARPVLVGVNGRVRDIAFEVESAEREKLQQRRVAATRGTEEERTKADRDYERFEIWKHQVGSESVFCTSSVFSKDMVVSVTATGEHEKEVLEAAGIPVK